MTSHSPAWQAARAARRARRAADPVVADRRRQHEARATQPDRHPHVTALAQAAAEREAS